MTDLETSRRTLEDLHVVLAMLPDGRSRICIQTSPRAQEAVKLGAVIWTPEEMLRYAQMEENERHLFRSMKMTFKASTEFRSV